LKKTSLFILLFILISCNDRKETSTIEKDVIPYKYRNYSNFQKKKYLDSIFNKLIFLNDDSLKIKSLFEICNQYYYHKDYISSIKTSKKAFDTASKLNDSLNIGRSLYYIGDCYLEYQKDSAYYYYKEAEKIFRKLNNKEKLALVLYNKAYLLFYEGNYVESEIEVIKALNCLKSSEKIITKYRCYSLQGSNHLELGEYDKAEEYFNLSADILKQMKREGKVKDAYYDYEITNTIDLCTAYDKKGEYKKSISALNEIVTKSNFEAYPKLKYFVYGNLAYSLMKDHQYALSNKYFKQALSLAKKENDELGYLYIIVDFGEYHLATKDTLKARELFNEATTF
jgi:tetratricopeptide (TPR) repeat protein